MTPDEELVERLCDLHQRMLDAIQSQRPYPVKQEIGKADSDTILSAAVFIERSHAATPLASLQEQLARKDAALRKIADLTTREDISDGGIVLFIRIEATDALQPPSGKADDTEMCDACDGSGFGVADTYCGKCGGAGGYPSGKEATDE